MRKCSCAAPLRRLGNPLLPFLNAPIRKRPGDIVQPGGVLGQVSMNSLSNFAHLHLSVSNDDQTVDPFVHEHCNRLFARCAKRIVARSTRLEPGQAVCGWILPQHPKL